MSLVAIPKLEDLVEDPRKVSDIPPETIHEMRGKLAYLDSLLLERLSLAKRNGDTERPGPGDRLLNVQEAATKLSLSQDYLYRNSDKLPFTVRIGGQLRFSEAGIERYIRQRMGR
jgi:predicted DNA-binding transcriptional regulator AlpA